MVWRVLVAHDLGLSQKNDTIHGLLSQRFTNSKCRSTIVPVQVHFGVPGTIVLQILVLVSRTGIHIHVLEYRMICSAMYVVLCTNRGLQYVGYIVQLYSCHLHCTVQYSSTI
jgi:hypothetical protein